MIINRQYILDLISKMHPQLNKLYNLKNLFIGLLDKNPIQYISINLSSTDLLNSGTASVCIPAQGEGTTIQIVSIVTKTVSGTINYSTNTLLRVKYDGGGNLAGIALNALEDAGKWELDTIGSPEMLVNTDIVLQTDGGNPTGGDKTIQIVLGYIILN